MGEARRRRMAGEDPRAGVTPTSCQRCGYRMDSASVLGDKTARPRPGDFSICARCGLPMRFAEGGRLRAIEVAEIEELSPEGRARLFIACAALGSQNNPMRQSMPGRRVAEVVWAEVPGTGKALVVQSEGPAEIGLAAVVICQGIAEMSEYDQAAKDAAAALTRALTSGKVKLPPFEVIRANTPKPSESA